MRDGNILISVIIPCFYESKYLRRCLDSIKAQTKKNNLEVILINDCSPNTTCEYQDVINEFKDDLNIFYYKTANNYGPGIARQIGLDNASPDTDFVLFIDDDDALGEQITIEEYLKVTDVDNYNIYYGKKYFFDKYLNFIDCIAEPCFCGSLFNYRFIKNNNIHFLPLSLDEDALFIYFYNIRLKQYYKVTTEPIFINNIVYNHIENLVSLTHKGTECFDEVRHSFYSSIKEKCKFWINEPYTDFNKDLLLNYSFNEIYCYLTCLCDNQLDNIELYALIKKYQLDNIDFDFKYEYLMPYYEKCYKKISMKDFCNLFERKDSFMYKYWIDISEYKEILETLERYSYLVASQEKLIRLVMQHNQEDNQYQLNFEKYLDEYVSNLCYLEVYKSKYFDEICDNFSLKKDDILRWEIDYKEGKFKYCLIAGAIIDG